MDVVHSFAFQMPLTMEARARLSMSWGETSYLPSYQPNQDVVARRLSPDALNSTITRFDSGGTLCPSPLLGSLSHGAGVLQEPNSEGRHQRPLQPPHLLRLLQGITNSWQERRILRDGGGLHLRQYDSRRGDLDQGLELLTIFSSPNRWTPSPWQRPSSSWKNGCQSWKPRVPWWKKMPWWKRHLCGTSLWLYLPPFYWPAWSFSLAWYIQGVSKKVSDTKWDIL